MGEFKPMRQAFLEMLKDRLDTLPEGSDVKVVGVVEEMEAEVVGEGTHAEEGEEHEEDADHTNHYHKPQYSVKAMKYAVIEAEAAPEEK